MFGSGTQHTVVWQRNIAEKINTLPEFSDGDFARMQFKQEFLCKKSMDTRNVRDECCGRAVKNNKIVAVTEVVLCLEFVLHELVQFVEVNVSEYLARNIAER